MSEIKKNSFHLLQKWMAKPLSSSFYERDTLQVAQELLGKVLVVQSLQPKPLFQVVRVVETEAYKEKDPACHAFKGRTQRSSILFGPPGISYVYFIYGMYTLLNFVTEPDGMAGAVLIRAVEPLDGFENRNERLNGPGKLGRSLGIQLQDNGLSLQGPRFYVVDDGFIPKKICQSKRVGIRLAKDYLWRFYLPHHPEVSPARENQSAQEVELVKINPSV